MLSRRLAMLAATLLALSVPVASASAAQARPARLAPPALTVSGTVADPASYTLGQLAALPAESVQVPDGRGTVTVTGVPLDLLVTTAAPVLPAVKNALLRVIVTASGTDRAGRPVSFALG